MNNSLSWQGIGMAMYWSLNGCIDHQFDHQSVLAGDRHGDTHVQLDEEARSLPLRLPPPLNHLVPKWMCVGREFKLPWREAGPPNHRDDKVDSDQ